MRLHPPARWALAVAALALLWLAPPALAGTLSLEVLDVGQGDSILLVSPEGKTVLIDAGDGDTDVVAELRARGVTGLDMVVATHPHEDHIGGMERVLSELPVGTYLDSGRPHTTDTYRRLMAAVDDLGIPYVEAQRGQRIRFGEEAVLTVLWPGRPYLSGTRSDENSNSVVLRLEHQGHCALLVGDAEEPTELRLQAQRPEPCEVLKVAHHGGAHSTKPAFLRVFAPRIALISVGTNPWHHPTEETLGRLVQAGVEVHRTDREGSLRVLLSEAGVEVQTGIVAITPGVAAEPPEAAPEPTGLEVDASQTRAGKREAKRKRRDAER